MHTHALSSIGGSGSTPGLDQASRIGKERHFSWKQKEGKSSKVEEKGMCKVHEGHEGHEQTKSAKVETTVEA